MPTRPWYTKSSFNANCIPARILTVEDVIIKLSNQEVYSLARETIKQTSIMNCGNYYTKKSRGLQDHLQRGNPASETQILYVLPHTWSPLSNFPVFVFKWEQVYIELRKLEEINGKRKWNALREYGSGEEVNPN